MPRSPPVFVASAISPDFVGLTDVPFRIPVPAVRFLAYLATQFVAGVLVNLCVPLAFFALILLPGAPYTFASGTAMSTLAISPFVTSVLSPLFLPLSIPAALRRRAIRPIRCAGRLPVLLGPRRALARHSCLGVLMTGLLAPLAFVSIALLSPVSGPIFIVGMAGYIALTAACVLPLSLGIFCLECNLLHIHELQRGRSLLACLPRCALA